MKKQKNNGGFLGILIIVLTALIIAAIFLFLQMKKEELPAASGSSTLSTGSGSSSLPAESESSNSAAVSQSSTSTSGASKSSSAPSSSSGTSKPTSQDSVKARIAEIDKALGSDELRLVSAASPLGKDFKPTLAAVASDSSKMIDKRVKPYLDSFLKSASNVGFKKPTTLSCYRSYATQTTLYYNKIEQLEKQGMSKEEATKEAGTIVAIPGTSEHQYGMSADIAISSGSLDPDIIEKMDDNIWYRAHAAEYGFILRYPKNKESITGIMYEPWHFRYVGVDAAKIITEKGLCLEEYLDSLKAEKAALEKKMK